MHEKIETKDFIIDFDDGYIKNKKTRKKTYHERMWGWNSKDKMKCAKELIRFQLGNDYDPTNAFDEIKQSIKEIQEAIKKKRIDFEQRKELLKIFRHAKEICKRTNFKFDETTDTTKKFINDELEISKDANDKILKSCLYESYITYCKRKNTMSVGIKTFGKIIKNNNIKHGWMTISSKQSRAWVGVKFKQQS